jgi:hypothetical protein
VRVAFLLQDSQSSDDVGAIAQHVWALNRHHGFDARLVLTQPDDEPPGANGGHRQVPVMTIEDARAEHFDIAVATRWETAPVLFRIPADRYVCLLRSLAETSYPSGIPERLAASLTTALPVRFIAEARWMADTVTRLQPGNRAFHVRGGVAKNLFDTSPPSLPQASEPLRIVVTGSRHVPQDGVDGALAAVRKMQEPRHLTLVTTDRGTAAPEGVDRWLSCLTDREIAKVLSEQHVILRLARAEGEHRWPLEAFHAGATCVTTPVSGCDEYVRHAWNGLVVGWDDPHGTGRALDLLARDRSRLHYLRLNALATARAWPSLEQSSRFMALALRAVHREVPPQPGSSGARVASDFATALAETQRQAWRADTHEALLEDLTSQKAWHWAMAIRGAYHRVRRPLGRARHRLRQLAGR